MTIGEKLRSLRKQRKMTLEDVAGIINVGRPTVLKYENGTITNIPSDKIEQLATLFNVSPAYLMGWSEDDADQKTSAVPDSAQVDPEIHIVSGMMEGLPKDTKEMIVSIVRSIVMQQNKKG